LFEKNDADGLTRALRTFQENPDRRNTVLEKAAARIRNQFSIVTMTDATLCSYHKVLAAS
jgi:hypothetical protein